MGPAVLHMVFFEGFGKLSCSDAIILLSNMTVSCLIPRP